MSGKQSKQQSLKMRIFIDSSCCGVLPLRTGCFIIAYVNLVMDTVRTVVMIEKATSKLPPPDPAPTRDYFTIPLNKVLNDDPDNVYMMTKEFAVGLTLSVLLFDIALMVGLAMSQCVLIRVYLIFNSILLAITVFGVVAAAIIYRKTSFLIIMMYFPCFCLELYFMLAIHSYYHTLKFIGRSPDINKAAEPEICEPFV